jgi:hypothetical protein
MQERGYILGGYPPELEGPIFLYQQRERGYIMASRAGRYFDFPYQLTVYLSIEHGNRDWGVIEPRL